VLFEFCHSQCGIGSPEVSPALRANKASLGIGFISFKKECTSGRQRKEVFLIHFKPLYASGYQHLVNDAVDAFNLGFATKPNLLIGG